MMMIRKKHKPDQNDRYDYKCKDYEVAGAGLAQCPAPTKSCSVVITGVPARLPSM
jgi:hypothetical protein